jgi:exosortase A
MKGMYKPWVPGILALAIVWMVLILLLEPAGSSMVAVWDSSETYTHGYVIMPIVLWLIWRDRHAVLATPARPDPWALIPALMASLLWLGGRVVGAQVAEHYALVLLLIISVWALFGRAMARALAFPLFFMLLMVPAGDSLVEPLIHFTADFTVGTVRLLGIPVYQEGTFLTLPTGQWSVVEACSGIRYFLASIVLGWLYAYLTYRTWWKRLAFGVASIVVPILANGLRATIIVLLGHYSSMTLAVGVDHLIYGWIWFGVVMLIMFWVGVRWREDLEVAPGGDVDKAIAQPRPAFTVAVALIVLVAVAPTYERGITSKPPIPSPLSRWEPPAAWHAADQPVTPWRPRWRGMDDERVHHGTRGNSRVMLFLAWYGAQRQGAELINSQNVLVTEDNSEWRKVYESPATVTLTGGELAIQRALLMSPVTGQRLLAWYWYRIDGEDGASSIKGKLRLALSKLAGRGDAAVGILVAAPYQEKPEEAEPALKAFLEETRPSLYRVIDAARSGHAP